MATNFGNNADSTLSPVVYKSTNSGTTWSAMPVLAGFDWATGHPEMKQNVGCLLPQKPNQFMPYSAHGIDLTVDSTGFLHLVSVVTAPLPNVASSLDSIAVFSSAYHWNYTTHHPIIWDMMTDGTTWNTILVDSLKTSATDVNAADSGSVYTPWPDLLGYGARIQVSRSVTGGKVFYSWADSDSNITHTLYNSNPDIYMKSYDITNQLVTPTVNETSGNGQCYFHYLSDVSYYDSNIGGYVCPLVYTTDATTTTAPFLSTDTVNYHYLNCATFYVSQYTTPANVYREQGASGITKYTNNSLLKLYPNPSNGIVSIECSTSETTVNLQITDVVGKEIRNQSLNVNSGKAQIDMSALNSGVYFITVKTNSNSSTQKIVLQR